MSTIEKQATPSEQPTAGSANAAATDTLDATNVSELSPYVQFFDAIDRLEDDRVLFGSASLEAQISRARVGRLRELAAAEWRKQHAA